jgi:hypothetical protein
MILSGLKSTIAGIGKKLQFDNFKNGLIIYTSVTRQAGWMDSQT